MVVMVEMTAVTVAVAVVGNLMMVVVVFLNVDWHFHGDSNGLLDRDVHWVGLFNRNWVRDSNGDLDRYLNWVRDMLGHRVWHGAVYMNRVGLDDMDGDRPVDRDGYGDLDGNGDVLHDWHGVRLGDAHGHFFGDDDGLDFGLPDDGAMADSVTEAMAKSTAETKSKGGVAAEVKAFVTVTVRVTKSVPKTVNSSLLVLLGLLRRRLGSRKDYYEEYARLKIRKKHNEEKRTLPTFFKIENFYFPPCVLHLSSPS